MNYRLPPLNALRAFEAAARHLSFKKAAEELAVTPTAVSHQIKGLEEYLGISLFRRLTRALDLTAEGEAMLPKVREGLECFASAVERTQQRRLGGRLTVNAPPTFAAHWLVPRLKSFAAAHSEIVLHLASSLRTIDSREQSTPVGMDATDPRDEDSEISIRFGTGGYPGCHADLILAPVYTAVCSPSLLRAKRPLREPANLRFHVLIHDDTIPDEGDRPSWADWLRNAGVSGVDARSGPHFSNSGLALAAAADGQGIALAPKAMVAAEVAAGRLAIPFDIDIGSRYAYYLVIREAWAQRPAVAAFRAWLLEQAAKVRSSVPRLAA
jgi:LysR family glycine cleavage system transcriptional activator